MCSKQNGTFGAFFPLAPFLIASLRGPSWQAVCRSGLPAQMPACNVRCSPPVISYLCLRLHQPASSPATSQPTSTSLLLGQRLSRGYFFCFSHLLSFFLSLPFSHSFLLFLPSLCPSICLSACLSPHICLTALPSLSPSLSLCLSHSAEDGRLALTLQHPLTTNPSKNAHKVRFPLKHVKKPPPCYRTHWQPAPTLYTLWLYLFKGVTSSLLVCHELKQLECIQKITFDYQRQSVHRCCHWHLKVQR